MQFLAGTQFAKCLFQVKMLISNHLLTQNSPVFHDEHRGVGQQYENCLVDVSWKSKAFLKSKLEKSLKISRLRDILEILNRGEKCWKMISASLHTGKGGGGGGGSFANSGYGKRNKLTKENSVAESDQINGEAHPFLHGSER